MRYASCCVAVLAASGSGAAGMSLSSLLTWCGGVVLIVQATNVT
jgi:hypothetical protein